MAHGIYRERGKGGAGNSALVQYDHDRFDVPEVLYRNQRYMPPFEELPLRAEYEASGAETDLGA